jgi:Na+/proline symporter
MAAHIIVPDLKETYAKFGNPEEAAYIAVCLKVLPAGMLGLVIAGLFAATMSTMDMALNVNAGFLVKNFYQPIFHKDATEVEQLKAGRITTVICGALMMVLAILYVLRGRNLSLFDAYLYIDNYIQAPLTVALFLSIFVRKTPAWAGWVTVVVGIFFGVVLFNLVPTEMGRQVVSALFGERFTDYLITNKVTFTRLITIPLCSIFFFATKYFYREAAQTESYRQNISEFGRRIAKPVDFASEVGGDNSVQQSRIMGTLALVYGGFVALGILIPNPLSGRLAIGFCASVLLVAGFLLIGRAKRMQLSQSKVSI